MTNAVSLFTGCGGSDLGLLRAGFDVVFSNDILPYAKDVHSQNLPNTNFVLGDISKIRQFPDAQLLVGCYPCQGFSQGGSRDPSKKINFLYREFDRALRAIRPKAFIVENVSGMTRADFSHLLLNQIRRYRLAGYRVSWKKLSALDFGVAQERTRVFIVGIRSDFNVTYEFPEAIHGPKKVYEHLVQQDVIADLPMWPEGDFDPQPFHWYYLSRNRRRAWTEPSKTIVSNSRHMPLHPSSPQLVKLRADEWAFEGDAMQARRLSYLEAARLQGFPSDFIFPDTVRLSKKYEVIGNAVPPPLFEAVASALPAIWD